ncbi:putative 2-dehydropantoate 2-reductase [Roseiconus lacunae]|uniref:putative 2-dehydropantoate 2-reductase n=1 Tax=Roseiconus lacunae TaxID=2605694 RepID=UPI001E516123|nr:putative 2-dehydropantoate 2-reductase [Roseiconus lacunae]MCD0461699.1 putative 2-dehydropantoate 2-reductase [Roseiconus lacunae]
MSKLSYAIIGSGAVGGLYGAMLARAGHDVHFLCRSDYEHIRQHGWNIESHWGDFQLTDVNVYRSADDLPPCDVTILALKTVKNHLLSGLLPKPMGQSGVVLVLQNGLGVEASLAEHVGVERVFGGCCFLCSNKVGPGHIRHIDYGRIVFGPYSNSDSRLDLAAKIGDELNAAGIEAQCSDDLNLVRWRKLMWNIPFNGLSVALDASTDKMIGDDNCVDLVRDIITEVHRAATACGATIDTSWIEKTIDHTRSMVPYDSSMRLDFLAGREMELQAILANPIAAAKRAGVSMPKTEMLYQTLRFMQNRSNKEGSKK